MTSRSISPCTYPGCRDQDGNARLTTETFCQPCRHRYRRLLDWIALDYTQIRRDMPAPGRRADDGSSAPPAKARSFGHPSEWASDTAAEIADKLNWAEDALRDHNRHEPPPHPGVREAGRVAHAYRYLTAQFDALCEYPDAADTATELADLHAKIRRTLGYTRSVQLLPTPCPWCDVAALVRDVGHIECRDCGKRIDEKHYEWLSGWLLDRLIDEYETREQAAT